MDKNKNAYIIGERLREIRGIRPKTKVAEQMGISYSALCKYEAGLRVPKGNTKKIIADYYGTSIENLFSIK